jgi:hypothetical protein
VAGPHAIGECAASALALGAGARLEQLKADLIDLYPRLRQAFPKARILALGYPSLFPLKAPPLYKDHGVLRTLLFRRWTLPEREAIRDWGFNLNRVILEAVLRWLNSGIESSISAPTSPDTNRAAAGVSGFASSVSLIARSGTARFTLCKGGRQ